MIRYIDATDSPDDRGDYSEIVDELIDLGFEPVGRVVAEPIDGSYEDIAADYDPGQAELFLAHCDVPARVLRSPDGDAFVDVSWFWESPSVRFRTELADGSLAETLRRWTYRPGLPSILEELWTNFDIDTDMTKRHTPQTGRSTTVAKTTSAREQWARHKDHVDSYSAFRSSRPSQHHDLAKFIDMSYRIFAHDAAVETRVTGFWKPLSIAYLVVGLLVVFVLFFIGFQIVAIGLALLLAVMSPSVVRAVIKMRILPVRLRPPFL